MYNVDKTGFFLKAPLSWNLHLHDCGSKKVIRDTENVSTEHSVTAYLFTNKLCIDMPPKARSETLKTLVAFTPVLSAFRILTKIMYARIQQYLNQYFSKILSHTYECLQKSLCFRSWLIVTYILVTCCMIATKFASVRCPPTRPQNTYRLTLVLLLRGRPAIVDNDYKKLLEMRVGPRGMGRI